MAADEAGGGGVQDGMLEAACNYVFATVDRFGLCVQYVYGLKVGQIKMRQIKKGRTNMACCT